MNSRAKSTVLFSTSFCILFLSMNVLPTFPGEGRVLDLYTQKGGIGRDEPGGQFVMGELVQLISRVTYNDYPVQQKLVTFEVRNPLNERVVFRTATTNEDGLAAISCGIPVVASSVGTWTAISGVEIAGEVVWDTTSFQVLIQSSEAGDVQITDFYSCDMLGVSQGYFPKKTTAYFNISVTNPAQDPKNVSIYLSVQDEISVPIGTDQLDTTIAQNTSTYYIMSVFLSKWAYVGLATACASLWEEGSPVDIKNTQFYIDPEDLTPPVIHILSPENTTYETENLSLVFTINERTTWIGYSLNGLENVTVGGNTTLAGLDNGSHRIVVYANDTSSNMGSSEETYFTILIVHDVAVIDLECSSAEVYVGQAVNINVTVINEGTMTETFNVSTYANSTTVEILTATNLSPNNRETLVFMWNTTNVAPGNYTIKAVASTVAGETDTADNTYVYGDVKITKSPVAFFTFSPTVPFAGETITFNASLSTPDGGMIISYQWSFGDGTPNATDVIATHAYAGNGTYAVTVVVTDSDGLTDTDCQNITVFNRPPIASFTESAETVPTGTTVNFNASSSYDPDGSIIAYAWNFGDGNFGSGVLIGHSYADDGVYNVTLTVTDNDGASSVTSALKTVLDRPPVANFSETAETVYTHELISFNASDSFDPDGTIVAYFWDFGDGANATGVIVDHGYEHNGTYIITLTVTDDDDMSASTSTVKNVLNRPDIAVSNVTSSKTVLGQGYSLEIDVTVTNRGDRVEAFDVTVYAGATSLATHAITLTAGNSTSITLTWNSTGFAYGNYTISAYAWPLPGETDIADNNFTGGWVYVSIIGDVASIVNGKVVDVPDGKVDMTDIAKVAERFGVSPLDPLWDPNCDITGSATGVPDGKIDMRDIGTVARNFGKTDP